MTQDAKKNQKTLLGHPRALYLLFIVEMWERFSYYGMRALLVFYLTKHFLFSDVKASAIYGAYGAMVYIMPVIGGVIADKYLGAKKAILYGAILLTIGHFSLAWEGDTSSILNGVVTGDKQYLSLFFLSLALIITGVGFLKSNISTIVGELYDKDDPRRDGGFTIFYMGINLGAFISALLCGYLGETYGWSYGFGAAGVGMFIGLIFFIIGKNTILKEYGNAPTPSLLKEKVLGINKEILIYVFGLFLVLCSWQLIQYQKLVGNTLGVFGIVMLGIIIFYSISKCDSKERSKLFVACTLIIFMVIFWALFEQAGSSLNLLADRAVNRNIFGYEVRASQLQSLNALFIIILAPIFSMIWLKMSKIGIEPSTPMKFALGILQVGLGFLVLVFGMKISAGNSLIPLIWIVLIYFLHTTGELSLSPVGLSMITKLSPPRIIGMMMGVFFLATAFGNYIAGWIAGLASHSNSIGKVATLAEIKAGYVGVYTNVVWLAIGIAVFLMILTPLLKKMMR